MPKILRALLIKNAPSTKIAVFSILYSLSHEKIPWARRSPDKLERLTTKG